MFQGFTNVANLSGGIQPWATKGLPVRGSFVPVAANGGCCGSTAPADASAAGGCGCDDGGCDC